MSLGVEEHVMSFEENLEGEDGCRACASLSLRLIELNLCCVELALR